MNAYFKVLLHTKSLAQVISLLLKSHRYYYDKNIMTKVHGKRYAYKFDFHGLMTACHQSQPQMPPSQPQAPVAGPSSAHVPSTSTSVADFDRSVYILPHPASTTGSTIFPTTPSYWATSAAGLSTVYQPPCTGPRYPP